MKSEEIKKRLGVTGVVPPVHEVLNELTTSKIKQFNRDQKKIEPKYLMGTKAFHLLGELHREPVDLFQATGEVDDYWIGMWVTGYGFFGVCFPKETSRELTEEDREKYNKMHVQIGSQPPMKLKV